MEDIIKILTKEIENREVDGYYVNGEAYFTREQIGAALGYAHPKKALQTIHEKHKERLDRFSMKIVEKVQNGTHFGEGTRVLDTRTQVDNSDDGVPNRTTTKIGTSKVDTTFDVEDDTWKVDTGTQGRTMWFYSVQGVYEICRWSEMPNADRVMDALYDMAEEVRTKGYFSVMTDEELLKHLVNKVLTSPDPMKTLETIPGKTEIKEECIPVLRADREAKTAALSETWTLLNGSEVLAGLREIWKSDPKSVQKWFSKWQTEKARYDREQARAKTRAVHEEYLARKAASRI